MNQMELKTVLTNDLKQELEEGILNIVSSVADMMLNHENMDRHYMMLLANFLAAGKEVLSYSSAINDYASKKTA
jgi:hypothetical protein